MCFYDDMLQHETHTVVVYNLFGLVCVGLFDLQIPPAIILGPFCFNDTAIEVHIFTQIKSSTHAVKINPDLVTL